MTDLRPGDRIPASEFAALLGKTRRDKFNRGGPDTRTWRGKLYASKAEMQYAQQLHADPGVVHVIEQPRLWLGVVENVYVPDFFVLYLGGKWEYVDVKGHEHPKFKRDKKLWRAYGPGPLRIVRDGRTVEVIRREQ